MGNALVVHKDRVPQSQRMYRAAQYVRMSTDYQQYSIENQAAVIAAYAQLHKLAIVSTYRDEGESGLKIENRNGLTALINDVQEGHTDFGHLLIFDISRWGRFQDVDESAYYEFICRKAGIKVAYCAEQFDNDGSLLSSIMKNIKRVMAAEFSRELSAKIHAGSLRLAAKGYKMGGPAAYGLQRLVVDDERRSKGVLKLGERKYLISDRVKLGPGAADQVKVVKWIFEEFLRHKSTTEIAQELNRRGILNRRGKTWRPSALNMLLRNEAYIGTFIYNRDTQKLGARRTRNPKDLWVRSEGAIEPIIEQGEFLRVRKIMAERRIYISEDEMLVRLRKVLAKKGKLSASIIAASPTLPSVTAYLKHFGTLKNIYRMIGYNGNQACWDKADAHKRWVRLHLENAASLRHELEKLGSRAVLDVPTECVRIDDVINVCFRVARCYSREGKLPSWILVRRVRWPKGWVVVLRLTENNQEPLDYLLLPSTALKFCGASLWFSEGTRASRDMEQFNTFGELSRSLVGRIKTPGAVT